MFCSATCSPVNQEQACGRKGCGLGSPGLRRNSITVAKRWIPHCLPHLWSHRLIQARLWLSARRSCLYLRFKMIRICWYLKKCWNESKSLCGSLGFCVISCLSVFFLPHLSFASPSANNPFPCLLCILILCLFSLGKLHVVLWQNPCYYVSQ